MPNEAHKKEGSCCHHVNVDHEGRYDVGDAPSQAEQCQDPCTLQWWDP